MPITTNTLAKPSPESVEVPLLKSPHDVTSAQILGVSYHHAGPITAHWKGEIEHSLHLLGGQVVYLG